MVLQTVTFSFIAVSVVNLRENLLEYSAEKYILFIVDMKKKKSN